jgi:hypothetical protein
MFTPNRPKTRLHTRTRLSAVCALALLPFGGAVSLTASTPAYAVTFEDEEQGLISTKKSKIVSVALPEGAFRYVGKKEIERFAEVLGAMAKERKTGIGTVEVLVWQNGAGAKKTLPALLKKEDFTYEPKDEVKIDGDGRITPFVLEHEKGDILGIWIAKDDNLLLAWAKVRAEGEKDAEPVSEDESSVEAAPVRPTPTKKPEAASKPSTRKPANKEDVPDTVTVELDANAKTVNMMKGYAPKMPTFPKTAPKAGTIRGYVYDLQGKPLKGAKIGARSTAAGGFYSGATAISDDKGWYEIAIPWGVAHYYCAGYAVDYGEGRAAMGLHPADGEAEGFASTSGTVENWVLMPYGIADRDGIQDQPQYLNNYYGGGLVLSWYGDDDERFPSATALPLNSVIELTLTPDDTLVDGSKAPTIVLRKNIGTGGFGQLYVNNIPAAAYRIKAKIVSGGALKMKEVGPYGNRPFGLEPKQATGETSLLFRPGNAKADMAVAKHGNWDQVCIQLERP